MFDVGENYADMLPVRVHSEDAFRGHLLLTFITTAAIRQMQNALAKSSTTPISLSLDLRNNKCKVFGDKIITQEVFKKRTTTTKCSILNVPL